MEKLRKYCGWLKFGGLPIFVYVEGTIHKFQYPQNGYYAPGPKGPPGASSNWIVRPFVCPSVHNAVPFTNKVQCLNFG